MRGYVINLPHRIDRWEQMQKKWGDSRTVEIVRFLSTVENPPFMGLVKAHRAIVEQAMADKEEMVLILEDDANHVPDFDDRFEQALEWLKKNEWDLFYGGTTQPTFKQVVNPELGIVEGKFLCNHFLLIHSRMFPQILTWTGPYKPTDFWYYHLPVRSLAITPMISHQDPSYSDIEKRPTSYVQLFSRCESVIHWAVHQARRVQPDPRWTIIQPKEKIFFCSFDMFNIMEFAHARKFVDIAKSIPHPERIHFSEILPREADWIFADQWMIPEARDQSERIKCKLGVVVSNMGQYNSFFQNSSIRAHLIFDISRNEIIPIDLSPRIKSILEYFDYRTQIGYSGPESKELAAFHSVPGNEVVVSNQPAWGLYVSIPDPKLVDLFLMKNRGYIQLPQGPFIPTVALITSYYQVKIYTPEENLARQAEYDTVLRLNCENPAIREIHLLCEDLPPFDHPKLRILPINKQPLYADLFQVANTLRGFCMITNSDIALTSQKLMAIPAENEVFALTRYEQDGTSPLIDRYSSTGSHDSFIFIPPIAVDLNQFDFTQNKWGSENRVIFSLHQAGYKLSNPVRSKIITTHYHQSDLRESNRERINNGCPFIQVPPS